MNVGCFAPLLRGCAGDTTAVPQPATLKRSAAARQVGLPAPHADSPTDRSRIRAGPSRRSRLPSSGPSYSWHSAIISGCSGAFSRWSTLRLRDPRTSILINIAIPAQCLAHDHLLSGQRRAPPRSRHGQKILSILIVISGLWPSSGSTRRRRSKHTQRLLLTARRPGLGITGLRHLPIQTRQVVDAKCAFLLLGIGMIVYHKCAILMFTGTSSKLRSRAPSTLTCACSSASTTRAPISSSRQVRAMPALVMRFRHHHGMAYCCSGLSSIVSFHMESLESICDAGRRFAAVLMKSDAGIFGSLLG